MRGYKLLTVVGARPQFIKAAALSYSIAENDRLSEVIVHSGQHYDDELSANFFEELNIPSPKYNLGIGSKSHNSFIGEFIVAFESVLIQENPDLVIVYGDTNTTSAAAIAAAKMNIPLAHVEAGLREFDKSIPEEVNKLLTDAVTDLYFTPTETGVMNLKDEGREEHVYLTGDISLDLLFRNGEKLSLEDLNMNVPSSYAFMTCHREANTTNENLQKIIQAINKVEIPVIWTLHPRTKCALEEYGLRDKMESHVSLIEPLGFWDTQKLLKHASFVLSDSGGIIKESYFHKVPCIVIDKQTEWMEAVQEGWTQVSGPETDDILAAVKNVIRPDVHKNSLGDGRSGDIIVNSIVNYLDAKQ